MKGWLRGLLGLAGMGGLTLLYAWGGERPRMRLQRYRLHLPGGLGAGLRILHLSDQHFGEANWVRRRRLQASERLLRGLHPDLILLTGDFLHNDAGLDAVEHLLRLLPEAPLGRYAVLGNHDYVEYSWGEFFANTLFEIGLVRRRGSRLRALRRGYGELWWLIAQIWRNDRLRFARLPNNIAELKVLLELYGVELLANRALPLPGRPDLWLAGVDDLVEGQADVQRALADLPPGRQALFLTHNPDLAFTLPPDRVALALAGHTHGGQVVLPWLGAVHTQGTRLPRRQPAGHIQPPGAPPLIVSRGMGESTPLRFRCPPEIVLIDLLPT